MKPTMPRRLRRLLELRFVGRNKSATYHKELREHSSRSWQHERDAERDRNPRRLMSPEDRKSVDALYQAWKQAGSLDAEQQRELKRLSKEYLPPKSKYYPQSLSRHRVCAYEQAWIPHKCGGSRGGKKVSVLAIL